MILGIVTVISLVFPQAIIYTQSFYSDQTSMSTAIMLFQFFAIQTVFYGGSSVFSGLLNANRDYLWSSIAPVANNIIVIATFLLYAAVAPANPDAALYIIAIGNPLGVFAQMAIQMPALAKNGIKLRPHINFSDPYIKETISLGVPALLVMIFSFGTVSVMNAASYSFADNGPSIIVYSRFWYVLPYSFFAIPITTSLFTELSHIFERDDKKSFIDCASKGCAQIFFMLVPFTLFLIVFSYPLVSMYHIGAFTSENIGQIASFMCSLSIALPFYGICTFFQKVFSSMRKMGIYAFASVVASIIQIALTMLCATSAKTNTLIPIESIAWVSVLFYIVLDVICFIYLKRSFNHIGLKRIVLAALKGLVLGGAGACAGWAILTGLQMMFGDLNGTVLQAFVYVLISGMVSLFVTFGIAIKLNITEAAPIGRIISKLFSRVKRK